MGAAARSPAAAAAKQDFDERERKLLTELEALRELRDKETASGDVTELRRKNEVSSSCTLGFG